jgi:hypothetical protein
MKIQSYVEHSGETFLVSTIDRPSSALECAGRLYSETMVWTLDENRKMKSIVRQEEWSAGCPQKHFEVCEDILERGIEAEHKEDANG